MNKYLPIYNSQLVKDNGVELSQNELLKFWNFINLLIDSRYSTFIMRGESNENLEKQYRLDTSTPTALAQCIFMVGEKGRLCWNDMKFLDPDNTSLENFKSICKAVESYIKEGCRGNGNRAEKMKKFFLRNRKFCLAFNDIDKITNVYENLPENDRKKVNLYYLSIAHTINSHKYKKASSFVSTTTNSQIADDFTNDATIYGWVPNGILNNKASKSQKTIDFVITEDMSYIKNLGLPYCGSPVYPEQKEIALRCGILPHFIIGFKVKHKFYVNPAIFRSMDKMSEINSCRKLCVFKKNLILQGLDVDQTNFEEFCRNTNFKRYYTFDGYKYEMHILFQEDTH